MLQQRIKRFISRPDFKDNFLKAIFKRLSWRLKWLFGRDPYIIPFMENLKINLPKTGPASLIYYQGVSEPNTADFVQRFLREGMTLVDIGAHIGEYTLIAAKSVGSLGQVHAFEPQEQMFPFLKKNVELNKLNWVTVNRSAVSEKSGEVEFEIFDEPAVSSIRKEKQIDIDKNAKFVRVSTTSLDSYWSDRSHRLDLVKVDVEGAEKLVFEGAKELMTLPATKAPTWIFEYAPSSYSMFNYQADDLLNMLRNYGYQIYQYCGAGKIIDFSHNNSRSGIINLIAAKDREYLLSLIRS